MLQFSDTVTDRVKAFVDLFMLALCLLPHGLTLFLQHLNLPLELPLQVLHPPRALSTTVGGLG